MVYFKMSEKKEIYGYCRVSTKKQKIDRQINNIKTVFPTAVIISEYYTGTSTDGRSEWKKLHKKALSQAKQGYDITIVFDSVSRMSRNADEGFSLYEELFRAGINLHFLKEPHINTDTYRSTLDKSIPLTGTDVDVILNAVSEYLLILAKKQIRIAFEQSEKEVQDLHNRTSEGMKIAALNGKQIGRKKGQTYITRKELDARRIILKNSKDFGGTNTDAEVIKLAGISRNTYYKYKANLRKLSLQR